MNKLCQQAEASSEMAQDVGLIDARTHAEAIEMERDSCSQ
jgi:hypothetical protein